MSMTTVATTIILIHSIIIGTVIGSPINSYNNSSFTCPSDDNCAISQCLYLNPDNCHTFWQCDAGKNAHLIDCNPYYLEFNDFVKVCDWASDQTCRSAQPVTTTTTEAPTTTTTEAPTTTTTEAPTTTTTPDDETTTTVAPDETTLAQIYDLMG
ncbi:unnamed protein product [Medioppia subpectinata]|uniref:Chitin-binding type-2 domain-containing protein n=1 Tax=Medioppia subpectinata TaxID=1979941 RepID=A0A7R9L138_9ACAR|nr:unnamed protein product [Medioppia subpectinata]CAG2113431.1 unnamed protein product [Medioppia subpectinata]